MSLAIKKELGTVAKEVCRELRKNSTVAERMFWDVVRDRRFHSLKFYRQYPIFVDDDGRETFFVADFYCHEKRLVVELDGAPHRYQEYKDRKREDLIRSMGVRVVRFGNDHVESHMEKVGELLEKHIEAKLSPSLRKRRGWGMSSDPDIITRYRRRKSRNGSQ